MSQVTIELAFKDRPNETKSLGDGKFTIGRDAGDLVLGDPLVSGQHAELTVTGNEVMFLDTGSTNGSFFNATKVTTPIMLSQGEGVKMGDTMLTVKYIMDPVGATVAMPVAEQQSAKRTFFAPGAPAPQAPAAAPAPAAPPQPVAVRAAPIAAAPVAAAPVAAAPVAAAPVAAAPVAAAPVAVRPSDQAPLPNPYAGAGGAGAPPPPVGGDSGYAAAPPPPQPPDGMPEAGQALAPVPAGAVPPYAPTGDDPVAYMKATIGSTWKLYQARFGDFAKMFGVVLVGGTLITSLIGMIPFAGLIAFPISLAMYFIMFFGVMGMSAEYCLHLVGGQPITVDQALARQKKRFGTSLLSTFLAGLLGWTFVLGVYLFQVQVGERRENFDINGRVWELFKNDWQRICVTSIVVIGAMLLGGFVIGGVQMAIVIGLSGGFLGSIAGVVFALIGAAFSTVTWSFFMLLSTRMYYDSRLKVEGVDPIPTVLQVLNSD